METGRLNQKREPGARARQTDSKPGPDTVLPIWRKEKIRNLRNRLLAWYRNHKRALPFRDQPTPYRVWISEIMLQQTRVQTVLPYYDRFLRRFPDIESLAAAEESDVLELWAGLGYYRRVRHLWKAAGKMATEWGGEFPDTLEEIMKLPGIGRYTAGAIHSIAFNQPEPVVDGNVRRVISRILAATDMPEEFYWTQAESWLARDQPAEFNQAFMELGALVCLPARPLCVTCPLRTVCQTGRGHAEPQTSTHRQKRRSESLELVMIILECKGSLILARQGNSGFIPGAWGLPVRLLKNGDRPLSVAKTVVRSMIGRTLRFDAGKPVRHAITHRRILAHVFRGRIESPAPDLAGDGLHAWFRNSDARRLLTSSLFLKVLDP